MIRAELLAPAGNFEKLRAVLHFGADAAYLAGKRYGLRAFADNFDMPALRAAIAYAHARRAKIYVAVNVFARNADFAELDDYLSAVREAGADAVIVSDPGVFVRVKKVAPGLAIHVSTQANTTNKYAAAAWADAGADRIVLARELTVAEIREIRDYLPGRVSLEAFVHGAMCISYSGRCLLSDYMTGRHGNAGECAQSCRWKYALYEPERAEFYEIDEDGRGAYILNSRDMNMLAHVKELADAGVDSFKIEGRVKSVYYAACITNAYRRVMDADGNAAGLEEEPYKTGNRGFTTGFYLGERGGQRYDSSKPAGTYDFCAIVTDTFEGGFVAEMRNRFRAGDTLEVLSPDETFNRTFVPERMEREDGTPVDDVKDVCCRVRIYSDLPLKPLDILRRRI